MSTTTKTRQQQAPAKQIEKTANRYDCFAVREYEVENQQRAEWSKVGVAWPHADGMGFRIILTSVPCDGKIIVRLHQPKAAE